MRLLVCGSRDWADGEIILTELAALQGVDVVIEGEAPGADTFARKAAEQMGIPVLPFPADWGSHGRAAGPIRNQQMLDEGKPDLVLAFTDGLNTSRGTADMVARARKAGIETILVSHDGRREIQSGR
ncbi:MAG: DUF2493 domain-containing protein [Euryarchaeota archaeon]|nr:DUF2493 domain-containing protein [Euryarchaeota archaeon]MDE1837424.1 DUF2493 domain-containing protein [Euryarchaeota archaeon]MDE1881949.1 DUF2493 domain-containing protein [Euryarchaeota archaeon]MDE2045610.1 DUF2493 domain-containing protein [Thermoplasmata archaeon]